ncbi:MAG: hypothetical protein MPW15_10130 [Candidatus Manganitrophus sp.]|nr:hypothetical protein [Candidatus Manganitrophus sp.]
MAGDEVQIYQEGSKEWASGAKVKGLLKKLASYEAIIDHFARKQIDAEVVRALTQHEELQPELLRDRKRLDALLETAKGYWAKYYPTYVIHLFDRSR